MAALAVIDEPQDDAAPPALPAGYDTPEMFLEEARERFQEGVDADRENRTAGMEDLEFLVGDQWDAKVKDARQRKGRPVLTINTLPQYVGQVIGDTRANRPSIRVRPAEDGDKKVAEVRQGLIRFIENQSNAQQVYALAGEDQVGGGIGHFRVSLDYAADDTFDQDIRIKHIPNPFAVVWDAQSVEPTGADARYCFVADEMDREAFEAAYPGKQPSELAVPLHANGWVSRDSVRLTEYWLMKETPRTMALLLPPGEAQPKIVDITGREKDAAPFIVKGADGKPRVRQSARRSACMYLITGTAILEGPFEYPLDRLPILKVTGREVRVAERRYRFGLIRFAKDSIRMKNLMRSSAMEWVAKAPRAQWLLHAADEDEAKKYRNAAKSDDPVLTYSGQIPPQRMDPASAPAALLQQAQFNDQDIKDVTGLHDASLGIKSNETSGKAIVARERQGDVATFMYHDNLNSAVRECGRVVNQLIPVVYDTARTIVVLGEDGASTPTRINDPTSPDGHIDLKVGKYDVVVETGPSYSTKRLEAADSMMQFVQAVPAAGQAAADLIAEAQDWPGAEAIAKRLKKVLPPGLVEEDAKDLTPEQAQARQQAQQQAAQAQQMQQHAAQLDMAERAAKAAKARAEAEEAIARLRGGGQPAPALESPLDVALKTAQVRKAQADADAAASNAGIAYFNLQQLVADPRKAIAEASKAEAEAISAHIDAAHNLADLGLRPLDAAHSRIDLQNKLNPPQAEAASPPGPPPSDPPSADAGEEPEET